MKMNTLPCWGLSSGTKFSNFYVGDLKIVKWKFASCLVEGFQVVLKVKQRSCSLEGWWCGHIQTSNSLQDFTLSDGFKFQGKTPLTRSRSHLKNTCFSMEHAHPTYVYIVLQMSLTHWVMFEPIFLPKS